MQYISTTLAQVLPKLGTAKRMQNISTTLAQILSNLGTAKCVQYNYFGLVIYLKIIIILNSNWMYLILFQEAMLPFQAKTEKME